MVPNGAPYGHSIYVRARKAFANSRECCRRCRCACYEAQSLQTRLYDLQHEIGAEVMSARRRRGRAHSTVEQPHQHA